MITSGGDEAEWHAYHQREGIDGLWDYDVEEKMVRQIGQAIFTQLLGQL